MLKRSCNGAMRIISFKKKIMKQKSYENAIICYICKVIFEVNHVRHKKYCKVRDHCLYAGERRGTTCITKELAEEFEEQFNIITKY